MSRHTSHNAKFNPVRLVWLITALGCIAGLVMIAIVWWALVDIRAERQRVDRFKSRLAGARASIEQQLLEEKWDLYRILAAEEVTAKSTGAGKDLLALIAEYRVSVGRPQLTEAFSQLERSVDDLQETRERCLLWAEQRSEMAVQLTAARRRVEDALHNLDELVQKTYGQKRLDRAVRIRQYRQARGEEAERLARRIIGNMAATPDLSAIRRDIADLAILCERLRGEEREDFLTDLKDNRIRTVLARLRRGTGMLSDELADARKILGRFATALFGTGYVVEDAHQTIIPGVGGMYGFAVNRLRLADEREKLRFQVTSQFDEIDQLLGTLSTQVDAIAMAESLRTERSLDTAWRTMLLIWLGTAGIFILISSQIIREVKRQIRAIEETNTKLDERTKALSRSREELSESEEQLRRLSSNLLKAQEQERRRIALELHDELGQSMAALKFQVRAVERSLGKEAPAALHRECENLRLAINEIIENVRRLSRDLSPVALEDLGLEAAIEYLVHTFSKLHNVRTSLHMEEISHLFSQEAQRNLYRIFQEILTNVGKHARADLVEVSIKNRNDESFFLVKDNGQGFAVEEVRHRESTKKGLGLTAIAERVRLLGGTLDIRSAPGEGTAVSFTASSDMIGTHEVPLQVGR